MQKLLSLNSLFRSTCVILAQAFWAWLRNSLPIRILIAHKFRNDRHYLSDLAVCIGEVSIFQNFSISYYRKANNDGKQILKTKDFFVLHNVIQRVITVKVNSLWWGLQLNSSPWPVGRAVDLCLPSGPTSPLHQPSCISNRTPYCVWCVQCFNIGYIISKFLASENLNAV